MALEVARLVAVLDLDDSGYNRATDNAEGRFSRLGGALATAVRTVSTLTVGAIGAAGAVGLSTAARMEQAEIGFTTMLGSAQKAQTFLANLSAFAAKTPFEFPELQTAASSLISVGISADKVIPIMTSLGNATSGMGTGSEGIKRATVALQQMNAAGRITGEDLNQLRDAGIPVFDLLAAATRKSKEEVAALAQKGKLGKEELTQLMAALESGKGLERFDGLMQKQSASLTGLVSTLKDTFSVGMAEAIQPLIPLIKDGLGSAIEYTAAVMPRLATGLQTAVTAVRAFMVGLQGGEGAGKLSSDMQRVSDVGARVAVVIDRVKLAASRMFGDGRGGFDFAAMLDKAEAAARRLWPQIQAASQEMKGIGPIVNVTGAVFGFLAQHVDTIVKYMPLLIAAFVAYKSAQALANVVAIASLPILVAQVASNFMLASANSALAFQLSVLTGVQQRSTIATLASGAAQRVSAAATAIWTGITQRQIIMQQLQAFASYGQSTAWGTLTATQRIATIATWLQTTATQALGAAMTFAMGPVGLIIIGIAALVAGIVIAYKNSETFRDIVTGAWEKVQAGVSAALGFFTGTVFPWFQALPGRIGSAIGNAASYLVQKGRDFISGLVSGYTGAVDAVLAWFTALPGRVVTAIGNIARTLFDKGSDLIVGFAEGYAAAWIAVGSWFLALPGRVLTAVGALGSTLVSKGTDLIVGFVTGYVQAWVAVGTWFAETGTRILTAVGNLGAILVGAGLDAVRGLADGIRSGVGIVADAASALASNIVNTIKDKLKIFSPSRVMMDLGKHTVGGYLKGLTSSDYEKVKTAASRLADNVAKAFAKAKNTKGDDSVQAFLARQTKGILAETRNLERATNKLEAAQEDLKEKIEAAVEYASQVRSSTAEWFNVAGFDDMIGSGDEERALGIEDMLSGLRNVRETTINFANAMNRLGSRGLNATALQRLLSAGPEAAAREAAVLDQATDDQIKQINDWQAEVDKIAGNLGDSFADRFFGAGVRAAQGVVAGFEKEQGELEKAVEKLALGMVAAVKKALGIASPSRVFAREVGAMIPAGIEVGVRSGSKSLNRAVAGLVGVPSLTVPGGVRGGDGMTSPTGLAGDTFLLESETRTTNRLLGRLVTEVSKGNGVMAPAAGWGG